jgi:RimJ/RimL family protein N-acetyltransferase
LTARTHYLKLITEDELADTVRMAVDFFHASPYKPYGVDEAEVTALAAQFLNRPKDKTCFLLMVNDEPHGMLAAISAKNIFNKFKTCAELVWWIDPEYRNFKYSTLMLDAYEYWAKEVIGAQLIQMVCLDDKLHNLYTRRGYAKAENAFVKEIK